MKHISAEQICLATGGTLVAAGVCADAGVCTDSRKVQRGSCFIALSGERFDGNVFAAQASQQGASIVVVSRVEAGIAEGCAVVLVEDTLEALQSIAAWWRLQLSDIQVIGLTGSSGKTSTKDLCFSVLQQKYQTTCTQGNLNNHIGLPLSLLSAEKSDAIAVWEMGMNHAGELAPLCVLAQASIGILSSIGSAHIEYLGSQEAIAQEKAELARSLPADGWMIYPAGCAFASLIEASTVARLLPVGGEGSSVRAENIKTCTEGMCYDLVIDELGRKSVCLPLHGQHMVSNSLLAAAAAWVLGLNLDEIVRGLEDVALTRGRLRTLVCDGVCVVDDSYNANPESMIVALETVSQFPQSNKIAVLGKMGELGEHALAAHIRVGQVAAQQGIQTLIVVGEEARGIAEGYHSQNSTGTLIHVLDVAAAAAALSPLLSIPDTLVLFKGSRSAGMERVMYELFPQSK